MAESLIAHPRMTDVLNEHTLVIPTYNRPALLSRLVAYYAARVPSMRLLVLDSSRPETVEQNRAVLAPQGANVRHIVYPTELPPAAKLARGLAEVKTRFASLCADDDLVFPEGLRQAVSYLAAHPDFVSAHGLYINFHEAGHDVQITREYSGPSNEAEHPGARIFRLCQAYESLFYGAFRAGDLKDILEGVSALQTLHYQELFQSVAALIKGKVRRFPVIYAARRSGPPAEPGRDKWQTYYWFAENPVEFLEHYAVYREKVWRFYGSHGAEPRMSEESFLRALDICHAMYFSLGWPIEYFRSVLQPNWPNQRIEHIDDFDMFELIRPSGLWLNSYIVRDLYRRAFPGQPIGAGFAACTKILRRVLSFFPGVSDFRSSMYVASLDRKIRANCRTRWRCRLSRDLYWLARVGDFRESYRELCAYLDAGPES